ncbi:MAG: hypothetical protein HON53_04160 [Planctomycetaceae bacterium]|nr:hypothetical protein [Planctomycetaceae bacterium]MBT6157764.1 hypothetical protein [Planctomycetaceae bacterium]MBT6484554.1 hypothetical protein [Planctomycetaceae bacterium]MBT6497635.1 hypothetical protein [Planctomycetaceae bacterium]
MKQSRLIRWTTVVAAVACVGLMLGSVSAQKKAKKKARVADPHQLMEGLVFPNCKALGGALGAEKTNFKEIAMRAALLSESGHVLMADGRCPDGVWAGACKVLRESGAEIVAKAKAEDKEGAAAAFKTLTSKGCGACHKVHKK